MNRKREAMGFILLMGLVSLFGDITYEGGRSIVGPYLAMLGAGAVAVGLIAGAGEFLGYALRLVSGFAADRTRFYWFFAILGYALILSIPLLGFVNYWQLAAFLIILERVGKAVRAPSRDAILSYATKAVGRGWGFGIHEAMDQVGAVAGPLMFALVLFLKGGYRQGFVLLWIPALLTLIFIFLAKRRLPLPQQMEPAPSDGAREEGRFSKTFWLYAFFTFFCVAGFANFTLISFHLKTRSLVSDVQIPLLYALAMGVDGVTALVIGKTYDKIGLKALLALPILTIPIPFLAFSHSSLHVVAGIVLWGAVMGIHETIIRAAVADLTHFDKRGFAYGIFNTIYGVAFLGGSVLMGFLYKWNSTGIAFFVLAMEALSIPFYVLLKKGLLIR